MRTRHADTSVPLLRPFAEHSLSWRPSRRADGVFTDKENVRRRTLFLMVRPAHATHDGSIAPLGASPRTVWSVGERVLTSSQHGGVAFPSIASMGSVGRESLLTYVPAF